MIRAQLPSHSADAPRKPTSRSEIPSRSILGTRIDCTCYAEAVEQVAGLAESGGGIVCVASVHGVMEAYDDPEFQAIMNGADLVTSDGVPLVWALKLLGLPQASRVYGPTLTPELCGYAAQAGIPVGFYGGGDDVLARLQRTLMRRFPDLQIRFAFAPPFRPLSSEEDAALVSSIEDSGARILFVGLGCPKQERFMVAHRESLSCALVGVGAAFDFIAGVKSQAPAWMQRNGLEWLYRLATEPRRLWRRYLYNNPRFVWAFARQLWREYAGLGA
jgi:N-acetylglucosaminyldiphosphoundecaprenol N-acetyl-beta-D-mannosaminyltransferase